MESVSQNFHFAWGLSEIETSSEFNKLFFQVNQVHGNEIIVVNQKYLNYSKFEEGDGLLFYFKDFSHVNFPLRLAIKTADCLPIVILGKSGVSHLHAGWRGLRSDVSILSRSILKTIEPFFAFIGPSICEKCFKVGEEFKDYFPPLKNGNNNYFSTSNNEEGHLTFNLKLKAREELINHLSLKESEIEFSSLCTFCSDLSWGLKSYRRDKTLKRNLNLLIINKKN